MRFQSRAVIVATLLIGLVATHRAEAQKTTGEKVQLKLNLAKGKKQKFVEQSDMDTKMSFGGQNADMKMKMTTESELEVKDVAKDGESTFEMVNKRISMSIDGGPVTAKYDSDDPATANDVLAGKLSGLVGKAVTLKFDALGKRIEAKDEDKDDQPNAAQLAQIRDTVKQIIMQLPEKPVGVGDTWKWEYKVATDPTAPMDIKSTCKLKELRGDIAVCKIDGKISSENGMNGTMEGELEINRKTGLMTKSVVKMKMSGKQGPADMKMDGTVTLKAS